MRSTVAVITLGRRHLRRPVAAAVGVLASAVVAALLAAGRPAAQVPPADLVLLNGKILTVDSRDAIAQAVAISGGRIVAVGTTAELRARVGGSTQVIDLQGRTAT